MDGPIQQVADDAALMIERGAVTYQKWTCVHCGSRQTMTEANTFFMQGDCEECGKRTDIDECGYLMIMTQDPDLTQKIKQAMEEESL